MNENILKLLQELDKNEDLLNEFAQKSSIDELYNFALSIVGGYTKEEFLGTMESIADKLCSEEDNLENGNTKGKNITDDELEKVSGGVSFMSVVTGAKTIKDSIPGLKAKALGGFTIGQKLKAIIKGKNQQVEQVEDKVQ